SIILQGEGAVRFWDSSTGKLIESIATTGQSKHCRIPSLVENVGFMPDGIAYWQSMGMWEGTAVFCEVSLFDRKRHVEVANPWPKGEIPCFARSREFSVCARRPYELTVGSMSGASEEACCR